MLLYNMKKKMLQTQHNILQSPVQSGDLLVHMKALNLDPHWYSVMSIITLLMIIPNQK